MVLPSLYNIRQTVPIGIECNDGFRKVFNLKEMGVKISGTIVFKPASGIYTTDKNIKIAIVIKIADMISTYIRTSDLIQDVMRYELCFAVILPKSPCRLCAKNIKVSIIIKIIYIDTAR